LMSVPSGKYAAKTEWPADEVNSTTRMALSRHSKRGPLFRTPVSVVFPEGPEIVHCDAEAVRDDSAFKAPQVSAVVLWLPTDWPAAGAARTASGSKPAFLIRSC